MATVYVPMPLRRLTGGQGKVRVAGRTMRELLDALERQYPGMKAELREESGEVRSFINVFINATEMRQLRGMDTPVGDTDEVSIIPAMAGGRELPETGKRGSAKCSHPLTRIARFRVPQFPRSAIRG